MDFKDKIILITGASSGIGKEAAIQFAKKGSNVILVARRKQKLEQISDDLKKFKVRTSLIRHVAKGTTGYSVLLTNKEGERTALVHRGVAKEFKHADIPFSKLRAKWLYMSSLGGNLVLAKEIIASARKYKTLVCFNPGKDELQKGLRAFTKR